jgi:hypothetical protein
VEDDFLLYRQDTRRIRVDPAEAEEVLTIGNDKIGYARITRRRHDRKPTGKLVQRWWYRCLERSGLVTEGATSGLNMHRARHTAPAAIKIVSMAFSCVSVRGSICPDSPAMRRLKRSALLASAQLDKGVPEPPAVLPQAFRSLHPRTRYGGRVPTIFLDRNVVYHSAVDCPDYPQPPEAWWAWPHYQKGI